MIWKLEFFVALYITAGEGRPLIVRIVSPMVTSPNFLASDVFNAPPMEIAIREANQRNPNLNISWSLVTGGDIADCVSMMDNIERIFSDYMFHHDVRSDVTAVIAPGCLEGLQLSRISREFGLIAVWTTTSAAELDNKVLYPNVILASPLILSYFTAAALSLLHHYGWTTVYIVYDVGGSAFAAAAPVALGLEAALSQSGATVYIQGVDLSTFPGYSSVLADIRKRARIVFFAGHASNVRRFMISASKANMTDGEYVYVSPTPFEYPHPDFGNFTWQNFDEFDEIAREAYQSLFLIKPSDTTSDDRSDHNLQMLFREIITLTRSRFNFTYGVRSGIREMPSPCAVSAYAAVHVLAQVLQEPNVSAELVNKSMTSAAVAPYLWNRCFSTLVGLFCFDENGQRKISLETVMLNVSTGVFGRKVFSQHESISSFKAMADVRWIPGATWPVLDIPICGFMGNEGPCDNVPSSLTTVQRNIVIFTMILLLFVVLIIARHFAIKKSARDMSWDLMPQRFQEVNHGVLPGKTERMLDRLDTRVDKNSIQRKAIYAEHVVWTKAIQASGQKLQVGRKFLIYINKLRDFHHSNVIIFFGILRRPNDTLFVTEWCSRSDVRSFLEHSSHIHIDWDIRHSLVRDLAQGIMAIHSSFIKYHGSLTPSACLVNAHLNLKLAKAGYQEVLRLGYGLENIEEDMLSKFRKDKVFFSPEYITSGFQQRSPQSDVFAVGQLISLIQKDCDKPEGATDVNDLENFMAWCSAYNPEDRPTARDFPKALTQPSNYNVVTKMLRRVELYAEELESAVLARTEELELEKKRCDALLHEMLPKNIVTRLRKGEAIHPEHFPSVTLSFSDISGFLEFVERTPAIKVMKFLDETHKLFDLVIADFDVYKVETIGDSYFLVSGLPHSNEERHASEVCRCVLDMRRDFSQSFATRTMQLRTGVHSGSCVAAVIGTKAPRYCLFGDAVNVASRMNSHGSASKVHISKSTRDLLGTTNLFIVQERAGKIFLKGKGEVEAFWVEPSY